MHGLNLYADAARADAATKSAAQWSALQDGASTERHAPAGAGRILQPHGRCTPLMAGWIDLCSGRRMAELYQGIQTHPGAPNDPFASFVPDMQEQMERGMLTGGDVEIPTADFTAKLAGTDMERALRPDIRFTWTASLARGEEFRNSNMPPADLSGLTDGDAGDVGVDHHAADMQESMTISLPSSAGLGQRQTRLSKSPPW